MSANAPQEGKDWSGLSGGVVILQKRDAVWLLGAIQQVPPLFGAGALEVAPIEAARHDPELQASFRM